jgi:CheY-like chemotaxis protein
MDVDLPFDRAEVEQAAGADFAISLSRSDVPVVEVKVPESLPNYCQVGAMVCDIFKKLGATCKAGTKSGDCPQLKSRKAKTAAAPAVADAARWMAPDQPFVYEEVAAAAGAEFANHLFLQDAAVMPYEELKNSMAARLRRPEQRLQPEARRMLVIDDEVAVNNNIRKILAKKGYKADQAASKAEALQKIQDERYALVILDLKMPGVKGLELLAAIRNHQPTAKVIIVTGYASIETAVEGARMGAVGYVPKPFTPDELRSAAERAVQLAA